MHVLLFAAAFAAPNAVLTTPSLFEPCDGPKPAEGSSAAFTASVYNPNEMAMFDHPRGLYFSHDGGSTWYAQTAPDECAPFYASIQNPLPRSGEPWCIDAMYPAHIPPDETHPGGIMMFCSWDQGKTFSEEQIPMAVGTHISNVLIDPVQPMHMLAEQTSNEEDHGGRLLESVDGGKTWQEGASLDRRSNLVRFADEGDVVVAKGFDLARLSAPYDMPARIAVPEGIYFVQVNPFRPSQWIGEGVLNNDILTYESTDNGRTFAALDIPVAPKYQSSLVSLADGTLALLDRDPVHPAVVVRDLGGTWRRIEDARCGGATLDGVGKSLMLSTPSGLLRLKGFHADDTPQFEPVAVD